MKPFSLTLAISLVVLFVSTPAAQESAAETTVVSRIESIGMFKNGLALVRRTVELPRAGAARVEDLPAPVHGTFWISSAVPVTATLTSRDVEAAPRSAAADDLQDQLVGKDVTVHFRDGAIAPISGRVIGIGDPLRRRAPTTPGGRMLVLETATGLSYVDATMVAHLSVAGRTVRHRRPVLILASGQSGSTKGAQPVSVAIAYVTRGMSWAPAYRVSLDDAKTLTIQQQAVIRNEMGDVRDAELQLISGFPSVQFAHVDSPFSAETTWATFFNQLSRRITADRGLRTSLSQTLSNVAVSDPAVDLSAVPAGEGVDLHYQSIGMRSLPQGEAMMLTTAEARASYERIVEWVIPDNRDEHGRPVDPAARGIERDPDQDSPWDAVRFRNPLPFPMTTGPAMITAEGRFNGQRQSFWANTGEQTTLQVTKALSVRTRHTEQEEQDTPRQITYFGNRQYRRVSVKGQFDISNHRQEPIAVVVRRQFSGELVQADEKPRVTLSEEGVYSVNARNQLIWSVTIEPGAARTVTFRYAVLVLN